MTRKTPCKRAELINFITAYCAATKTENKLLMGLAGDALNKVLDTLTFGDDLEQRPSPAIVANPPSVQKEVPSARPASIAKRRTIKKESEEDF